MEEEEDDGADVEDHFFAGAEGEEGGNKDAFKVDEE